VSVPPAGELDLAVDEGPPRDAATQVEAIAPVDAPPPDAIPQGSCPEPAVDDPNDPDMDHDGIPNADDNCPRVYNPDQANEDGDKFGDACDKCPPYPDDDQPNADGDCVSDACDPRPFLPGDSIALFEGFANGVPPTWIQSGTWTASDGDLIADAWETTITISVPGSMKARDTLTAAFIGRQDNDAAADPSMIGALHNFDRGASPEHSELCYATNKYVDDHGFVTLTRGVAQRRYDGGPPNWCLDSSVSDSYLITDRREDLADPWPDLYDCGVFPGTSPQTPIPIGILGPEGKYELFHFGTLTFNQLQTTSNEVGLRVTNARARFKWLMIVHNDGRTPGVFPCDPSTDPCGPH
jgi:hypothetical protein